MQQVTKYANGLPPTAKVHQAICLPYDMPVIIEARAT